MEQDFMEKVKEELVDRVKRSNSIGYAGIVDGTKPFYRIKIVDSSEVKDPEEIPVIEVAAETFTVSTSWFEYGDTFNSSPEDVAEAIFNRIILGEVYNKLLTCTPTAKTGIAKDLDPVERFYELSTTFREMFHGKNITGLFMGKPYYEIDSWREGVVGKHFVERLPENTVIAVYNNQKVVQVDATILVAFGEEILRENNGVLEVNFGVHIDPSFGMLEAVIG